MGVQTLGFHLTDRCQLDCQHCLRDPAKAPKDFPFETLVRVLREGRSTYGVEHIAFSGGEPTLYPRFVDAVDAVVDEGLTWHPVTNGKRFSWVLARLNERRLRREKLTAFTFRLDGADEATHDGIRGQGSFREVMAAVAMCVAEGLSFVPQMVIHAKNVHQIEQLGLMAAQLGARQIAFAMMQPTGTHHDRELFLPPRTWVQVKERLEQLRSVLQVPIVLGEGFPRPQRFHACLAFSSEQLHVDVEGNVVLCCQHAGIPSAKPGTDIGGNLTRVPLMEAHLGLLDIVHDVQRARVRALSEPPADEWDRFTCNGCLKYFGKPHWRDQGVDGPMARRERWRGAWARDKLHLPVLGNESNGALVDEGGC